jgi:hypothetical protein
MLLGSEAPIGCCSTFALGAERQTEAKEAMTSAERCMAVVNVTRTKVLDGSQEVGNIPIARDLADGQARLSSSALYDRTQVDIYDNTSTA